MFHILKILQPLYIEDSVSFASILKESKFKMNLSRLFWDRNSPKQKKWNEGGSKQTILADYTRRFFIQVIHLSS